MADPSFENLTGDEAASGNKEVDVFALRDQLIHDYSDYISSFIQIRDKKIRGYVDEQLASGLLWPDALVQLNPAFQPGHKLGSNCRKYPTSSVLRRCRKDPLDD